MAAIRIVQWIANDACRHRVEVNVYKQLLEVYLILLFLQARGRDEKIQPISLEHVKLCAE